MTIGEVIRAYREANQISQRQFAARCGVSNGYISMLENGKNPSTDEPILPSLSALKRISAAMGIQLQDLMIQTEEISVNTMPSETLPRGAERMQTVRLPLLGTIACGEPIWAEEQQGEFVPVSGEIDADFCLRAAGDSMIGARIYDGDIVFIRSQPTVDNGQIAAVLVDGEATLKRVYYYPEKQKLILTPENPAYEPLVYSGEELTDIRILGRAVAFQSLLR